MTAYHNMTNLRLEVEKTPSGLPNLAKNPSGAKGAWAYVTPVASTNLTSSGVDLTFTTTPSQAAYLTTEFLPVAAAQWVAARYDAISGTSGHQVRLRFEWYNASKALLSSSTQSGYFPVTAATNYLTATQAPASTAFVKLRFDFYSTTAGANPAAASSFTFTKVMVTNATNSSDIQNLRVNLVANPNFETDTVDWDGFTNAAVSRSTATAQTGTASMMLTCLGSSTDTYTEAGTDKSIPVVGGNDYVVSAYFKSGTVAKPAYVGMEFYDSNNQWVGYVFGDNTPTTTTSWTRLQATTTAPSNAVKAVVWVGYQGMSAGQTGYVDSVMMERGTVAGTYFDGSMTSGGGVTYSYINTKSYTNLVWNPSFETNTLDWSGDSAAYTVARVAGGTSGSNFLRTTVSSGYSSTGIVTVSYGGTTGWPVVPYKGYNVRLNVILSTTFNAANHLYVYVNWFDASGSNIGFTYVEDSTNVTDNTWLTISERVIAPVSAAYAQLVVQAMKTNGDVPTGHQTGIDAVSFVPAAAGPVDAYFDGATTDITNRTYDWTGTVHNSTSTLTIPAASQRVEAANFAFVEPIVWRNILGPTHSIDIERGALEVGTLTASILDATLDPAVSTDLALGRAIRLQALNGSAWENVFEGRIDNARVSYSRDEKIVTGLAVKTNIYITATDNISVLSNQQELRGMATIANLPYILEGKSVPWNVNGSGNQVASAATVSFNDNASVLDQVALTRDSVSGYAWVDRNNVLCAYDSTSMGSSVACNFTDVTNAGATYDYYSDIDASFNTEDVINQVVVNWLRTNATTGESEEVVYGPYSDSTSISTYGAKQATFTMHGATESPSAIATFANNVLTANKTPVRKASALKMPVKDARSLGHAATIGLYALANVKFSTVLNANYRVTSIKHSITTDAWNVTYGFGVNGQVASPAPIPLAVSPDVTDGTWIVPTATNSWVNFGAPNSTLAYMRKDGIVYLKGTVKSGTIGAAIFTLPVGYRPAEVRGFVNGSGTVNTGAASTGTAHTHPLTNAWAHINVYTTGAVQADTGINTVVKLDGICFLAEA